MNRRTKLAVAAAATVGVVAAGTGGAVAAVNDGDSDSDEAITGRALERASAAALEHTGGGQVTDTERDDEQAPYEVEVTLDDGRQVDVHLDRDFRVVPATDSDDGDDREEGDDRDDRDGDDRGDREEAITGRALERASAAALEHTGGGQVTDTEQGDEQAPYEVEVTMEDGREVDVHLDRDFRVIPTDERADD